MSSASWETDSDFDEEQGPTSIMKVSLVDYYVNHFKNARTQLREHGNGNFISISYLRGLPTYRLRFEQVDDDVELMWYRVDKPDHYQDTFTVINSTDFDVILGAEACKRMNDADARQISETFHTMLTSPKKYKNKAEEAAAMEEEKRQEDERKRVNAVLKEQQLQALLARMEADMKMKKANADGSKAEGST